MTLSPENLADGEVRKPYFFTHGPFGAVVCADCAPEAPEPEKLVALYTASRLYRCGHCSAFIGPASTEEAEAG